MYPVYVCDGILWIVVYDIFFRNCVESLGDDHEVTDAFSNISHLCLNITEESVTGTSPHDHGCL